MQQILLPGTNLKISRFSFGTGGLFNVGTSRERGRLLAAACDHGFTHFDTAPYYGFGIAERDLCSILTTRPQTTVATKVGIYSPGGEAQSERMVFWRKAAGKLIPALSRPTINWSIEWAKKALSGSLRRLGRDHVDLYLLHEPDLALIETDEWLRWLEVESNRVAYFGVALDANRTEPFIRSSNPLASVVQTFDSIQGREADTVLNSGRPLQLTYGYVSALRARTEDNVSSILRKALYRNVTGSIIVSTSKISRLRQYSEILAGAERFPSEHNHDHRPW
jgi:aryl-alcohol dehydrogenase-like predicted oxidoreductase